MAESANNPMLSAVTEGHQNVGGITNNSESTVAKTNNNNNATRPRGRPRVITTSTTSSNSGGSINQAVGINTKITRKKNQTAEAPPSTSNYSYSSRHTRPGSSNSQTLNISSTSSNIKNQSKSLKSPRKRIIDTDTEDTEEETRTKDRKKRLLNTVFEAAGASGSSSTIASRTRSHGNVPEPKKDTKTNRIKTTIATSSRRGFTYLSAEDTSSAEESLLHKVKKTQLKYTRGTPQLPTNSNTKLKRIVKDQLSAGSKFALVTTTEASSSRNLRSHHLSGFVANTSQATLSNASTSSAGASGSSYQAGSRSGARLASNSSGLSIVAVPKKRQKVGEHQRGPENSGYSDKLSNLGARLARGSGGREPQSNSSDIQVRNYHSFV